ncbi:ATP-binding protein [Alcanivorax sp. P2S70]|uniref:ATP-binding protein n=1 Tax=Alcanivorax TaxID=59753 RepID=UPI0003B6B924|nr:ATP-binding protein [Alcanivorax sp. P2S70]ERP89593.1 ATP-binding protein [Alcanivorax sp. P2S70]|tara:strand:- start:62 stop:835 length:774 start_codon:yes stop_codon:yes gene_type:complete
MNASSPLDWRTLPAAIWRGRTASLRPVQHPDPVRLDDLLGIDEQKRKIIQNTERFLAGQPCNHVLLWGSRGTGKSSIVKALLNAYAPRGLRVIEVDKDDLHDLPEIVDDIRERRQRFIIYCDDLSFEDGENQYKHLKSVLEGSLELPPENVRIYATSNRRHLLPEYMKDNAQSQVVGREIHHGDAVEEKISLADRFGLGLSFYPISEPQFFEIVDHLFGEVADREQLHIRARRFSIEKGVRSGRTARQFYNQFVGEF